MAWCWVEGPHRSSGRSNREFPALASALRCGGGALDVPCSRDCREHRLPAIPVCARASVPRAAPKCAFGRLGCPRRAAAPDVCGGLPIDDLCELGHISVARPVAVLGHVVLAFPVDSVTPAGCDAEADKARLVHYCGRRRTGRGHVTLQREGALGRTRLPLRAGARIRVYTHIR